MGNESPTEEQLTMSFEKQIEIVTWVDFLAAGKTHQHNFQQDLPSSSDLATINYTSGTTGNPKGVMLSHRNLVTVALGIVSWTVPVQTCSNDIWFSYLPMAHIFERIVHASLMVVGAQFWFSSGDLKKMLDELQIVKPTIFGAVPRVMNRLYDKIQGAMNDSMIKKLLITQATSSKRNKLNKGFITNGTIWDKLVLKKIQNLLGGRIHTWVSGAAPLDPQVRGFLREIFGCMILESYGSTECCGSGSATSFANYQLEDGCVGPPQPWNEIKLESVQEMGYQSRDGVGEVCIRGDNIMIGYYKNKEKTEETIDKDGWLHTGDIGRWNSNGTLKIIDRKKHIYKLSQGEYIAPEKIENNYSKHPLISQIFIWGSSFESYNVAVIVPERDEFQKTFKCEKDSCFETECQDASNRTRFISIINDFGRENGLKGFEVIKSVHLDPEPFSVENGLLTPTQKAKRPMIKRKYEEKLKELYTNGPLL